MKYKLVIDKKLLPYFKPEVIALQNQIGSIKFWNPELDVEHFIALGFLVEFKEPINRQDAYLTVTVSSSHKSSYFFAGWELGRENLLLEQEIERKNS